MTRLPDGCYGPPYFLLHMDDLWAAWRKIQGSGEGEASGQAWRLRAANPEKGVTVLHLEIEFLSNAALRRRWEADAASVEAVEATRETEG